VTDDISLSEICSCFYQKEEKASRTYLPRISVIIAAYNAEKTIANCIESVLANDYENFEIIAVNNNSTDNTVKIIEEFPVKLLHSSDYIEGNSPGIARNVGVMNSDGEIIAFTDSDCVTPSDWLFNIAKSLVCGKNYKVIGVGGPNYTPTDEKFIPRAIGALYRSFLGGSGSRNVMVKNKPMFIQHNPFLNVGFFREVFEKVGKINNSLLIGEDLEFDLRIKKKGLKLLYIPEIEVGHYRRNTVKSFSNQMYNYGKWRVKLGKEDRSFIGITNLLSLIYFSGFFMLLISSLIIPPFFTLFLGYVLIYMSSITFNSTIVTFRNRSITIGFLSLFLAILLHLSYGWGTLRGLLSSNKDLNLLLDNSSSLESKKER